MRQRRGVKWTGILSSDKVIDCGTHWEVVDRNGTNQGIVYWEEKDAKAAHAFLAGRSTQTKKQVDLLP